MVCTMAHRPRGAHVSAPQEELQKTPLHALHLELGARMVPFAGYSMPVQYPSGLLAEHHHTRASAEHTVGRRLQAAHDVARESDNASHHAQRNDETPTLP